MKTAIEKWANSGTRRNNLDSVGASKFIELQNKYNVNAVFAIAVFQQENQCGAAKDAKLIKNNTNNWGSIKGNYNGNSWTDSKGNTWRVYPSYTEATEDFMRLIKKRVFLRGKELCTNNISKILSGFAIMGTRSYCNNDRDL